MNAEELRTFAALRIPAIVNAVSTRSWTVRGAGCWTVCFYVRCSRSVKVS